MKKLILIATLCLLALTITPALAQVPEGKEYTVQADDWLSKVAEKEYGDPLAYPVIVEATNAKAAEDNSFSAITNPNVIEVGQKLWLPADIAGVESPAATAVAEAGQFVNLEKIACPEFISTSPLFADEVEGKTYECGLLAVPEN